MKKNLLSLVLVAAILALSVGVGIAAELKVGAEFDLIYQSVAIDDEDMVLGSKDEVDAAGYDGNVDVSFTVTIDENTTGFINLDADMTSGADVDEAWLEFRKAGGLPIDIKVGLQEQPFGLDKNFGINDPYTHGSTADSYIDNVSSDGQLTNLSADHLGEDDDHIGIKLTTTPLGDSPKLEIAIFENTPGQGAGARSDKPQDDGISQSFAARLTSTRVAGLTAEVSGIVKHNEDADFVADHSENEKAWSIGLDYKMDPVEVYAEIIMTNDLGHDADQNQTIMAFGVSVAATDNISVGLEYSAIEQEDETSTPGDEAELSKFSITPTLTLANGVELLLEYGVETFDSGAAGANDVDATSISLQVVYEI